MGTIEKNLLEKSMMGSIVLTKYIRYTIPSLQVHYELNMPRVGRFLERSYKRLRF
jgi:hypothetical protein